MYLSLYRNNTIQQFQKPKAYFVLPLWGKITSPKRLFCIVNSCIWSSHYLILTECTQDGVLKCSETTNPTLVSSILRGCSWLVLCRYSACTRYVELRTDSYNHFIFGKKKKMIHHLCEGFIFGELLEQFCFEEYQCHKDLIMSRKQSHHRKQVFPMHGKTQKKLGKKEIYK